MQTDATTIYDRMKAHDGGSSGASLEGPFSPAAALYESSKAIYVPFGDDLITQVVTRLQECGINLTSDRIRSTVFNVAEAVACGIWRVHILDEGALGTNCTSGGGVFGSPNLRINILISHIDKLDKDVTLRQPAITRIKHDAGLMVSLIGPCTRDG